MCQGEPMWYRHRPNASRRPDPLSAVSVSSELKLHRDMQRILPPSPGPGLDLDPPETPPPGPGLDLDPPETPPPGPGLDLDPPEELRVKQEDEPLPVSELREEPQEDICSEPRFSSRTEREHGSYTDNDDDWEPPFSRSAAETEADGDLYNQLQTRDESPAAPEPYLCPSVNDGDESGTARKKQECPFCQKGFGGKKDLQRHIRVHTGERPFTCSICQKTFTYKGNLVAHSRLHTGERPFSCLVCQNTFAQSSSLKEHMKTHTNEKPYSCSFCEKTFSHKTNLTTHMRVHTREKPYRCSLCDKTFALRNTLVIHTRQHTGEKPYSCSLCDKQFCQGSHLYKHMRRNHSQQPPLH